MLIQLKEGNKVPSRVQLLRTGEFNYDGEKLSITPQILTYFKKNFDDKVRGYEDGKLPVDYFHDNEKIAAGWMSNISLEQNGNELWADVQWTPNAEKMIADGELRYLSAEFHFDYQHNEGGKTFGPTLFGAGLTNRPFIKGMKPVKTLSEKEKTKMDEKDKEIAALKAKITEMEKGTTELAEVKKQNEDLAKKLKEQENTATKALEEKATAEKKSTFDKMLAEGKAVEAQREPFMAGDMVKFSELAVATNAGKGSSGTEVTKATAGTSTTPAQDKVLELAETVSKEKKISLSEGVSHVLKANKTLREQYEKEVAVG